MNLLKSIILLVACFLSGVALAQEPQTLQHMSDKSNDLQHILDKSVDNKKVFGASFAIKHHDEIWRGVSGNIETGQPYFIASTTKLFTSAIVFNLHSKDKLSLDDKIAKHLPDSMLAGLWAHKGQDHSADITIKQLLSHTSGLPDYFQGKNDDGVSLEDEITGGNDQSWTVDEAVERGKKMKPRFAPGTKGKAHYSDVNYQLLGKIIEVVTNQTYAENCQELIFEPLNLKSTYVYTDPKDSTPRTLYYKNDKLMIPKAMSSFGPDGGIVSTTDDMLVFIEAFFTGKLFPEAYLDTLKKWNKIFFPLESGTGIHRFKLPWFFDPMGRMPELIGHSGLSGALAFYAPKENLFVVGTVNQVAYPSKSFNTMAKLIQKTLKK